MSKKVDTGRGQSVSGVMRQKSDVKKKRKYVEDCEETQEMREDRTEGGRDDDDGEVVFGFYEHGH